MAIQSPPCILVIFGATGDLTARKLLPALYHLDRDNLLPPECICVGVARKVKSHKTFRSEQRKAISAYSRSGPVKNTIWKKFGSRLFYYRAEFSNKEAYPSLNAFLHAIDEKYGTKGNRIYYLSTQPQYFSVIVKNLHDNQMLSKQGKSWSRVVIEKPFGHDLHSSQQLQKELAKYLDEKQIYRVDHYLAKEAVKNIPAYRFANITKDSLCDHQYIDSVQITIAEEIGIGTRGNFFEGEGLLRDMIQNHMMQLLSLVAMEPPKDFSVHAIQEAKIEALRAIRLEEKDVVRGQYSSGYVNGKKVSGYREEKNVDPQSYIETYVAMKLFIDTPRWKGVPFYLRAGKRLPRRIAEITVIFKPSKYPELSKQTNSWSIRVQPNEAFIERLLIKTPVVQDESWQLVSLEYSFQSSFKSTKKNPQDNQLAEAYENLFLKCMSGDHGLFASEDEIAASWRILTPILKSWEKNPPDFPNYEAGTWGPGAARKLIEDDGRYWMIQ